MALGDFPTSIFHCGSTSVMDDGGDGGDDGDDDDEEVAASITRPVLDDDDGDGLLVWRVRFQGLVPVAVNGSIHALVDGSSNGSIKSRSIR